ncbi:galactose mutarotase-like domain-containing protein [Dissophora ornata]|nr:galactose mutarotase-like domain-containing protein [Dissophora ornata]
MPVKTTTLSTKPVLVQQHELSINLDSGATSTNASSTEAGSRSDKVLSATILTYGATLTHLTFPDRWSQPQDVVLGFDNWQDYLAQAEPGALNPYFGAVIGRTASSGSPHMQPTNWHTHTLKVSNGVDCHHGGPLGFDKQHWTTLKTDGDETSVTLQLVSSHGQNGYPGRLVTKVKYWLTKQGELFLEYWAQLEETDGQKRDVDLQSTIVSLTNHTYWNLDGVLNPPEDLDQDLLLNDTSKLVELGNSHPVPTGKILDLCEQESSESNVQGYKPLLDFTSPTWTGRKIGPGLDQIPGGYGYDHVYALDPPPESNIMSVEDIGIQGYLPSTPHVATLISPRTGIRMDLSTSEAALVLYAAGYVDKAFVDKERQQRGVVIEAEIDKFAGISLEPTRYPDAIHHREWAKMVTLHHDEVYRQKSVYKFSVEP